MILFFQILVVVRDQASALRPELIYSVRSLGAGRRALFRFVYLPATVPAALTALRVSVGTAIAVLFFAESFATTSGLGYYIIIDSWGRLAYPEMYAGVIAHEPAGAAALLPDRPAGAAAGAVDVCDVIRETCCVTRRARLDHVNRKLDLEQTTHNTCHVARARSPGLTDKTPSPILPPHPEKRSYVRQMFTDIAPRYDLMNRLMTLGRDQVWRRTVVRLCNLPVSGRLLDVATGTGDIGYEALRSDASVQAVGVDLTREMMVGGQGKHPGLSFPFAEGDALALPFADGASTPRAPAS